MTRSLLGLADRLAELEVSRVVMEATSDYWKSPFFVLEASGFETWLVNARDVKHLPGRPKTDRLDAVWLCKVAERQMLRPTFVPPAEIRMLRDLTRYRRALVATRTSEKHRVEKLLEDAGIKLSVVASDIFGVSGRDMMAALIAGQRDPQVLAGMARGLLRKKNTDLVEAFAGRFTDHHGSCWPGCWTAWMTSTPTSPHWIPRSMSTSPLSRTRPPGWPRSPASGRPRPDPRRRDRGGHDPLPHPRAPGLLGRFAPGVNSSAGREERQRRHRAR